MLLQSNYKNNNNNNTNVVFNPNATRFMPQQQQQQQQPVTNKKEDNNTNLSFFDTEKLLKFASTSFDENKTSDKQQLLPSYVETAWNSVVEPAAINKDQWMNDISIGINIHNIISQANSPLQDDNASSTSSLMSRSSDSGFRSTFFIGDEETNKQIVTGQTINNNKNESRCQTPFDGTSSLSEHLEFTYSHTTTTATTAAATTTSATTKSIHNNNNNNNKNWTSEEDEDDDCDIDCDSKSCVSSSDTSDDASVINDDHFTISDAYNMHSSHSSTKYTQQLIKDVESFMKKSLDIGIYSCTNKTNSFFVEPEDVLRPLKQEDYNEYQLFPMMEARFVNSYPEFF